MNINTRIGKTLFKMTIFGEPHSKANSRKVAINKATGRKLFIKSKGAREYCESFIKQVANNMVVLNSSNFPITCKVILFCVIYYTTERKDLDESLVMDCLEKSGVIKNDRQIRTKYVDHDIDKCNPRAEIILFERVI